MEAIKAIAQSKFGLTHCAASHCKVQRRDSRRRGGEGCGDSKGNSKGDSKEDSKGNIKGDTDHFFGDVMANVHFMLQHLRDHGLRTISKAPPKDEEHKAHKEDDDEIECVDAQFADKAAQIAQSQKVCGAELGASSKFTIQIGGGAPVKKDKSTLMDALCAFLRVHGDLGCERVLAFLDAEHFDSESVQIDITLDVGNIDTLRADICGFLRDYRIDGRSFSTGIAFQYHAWYESKRNADEFQEGQGMYNKNDYSGHPLSALFVHARFVSIKSEVLNSSFLGAAEFEEFVVGKTNRYFATATAKPLGTKNMTSYTSTSKGQPLGAETTVTRCAWSTCMRCFCTPTSLR